MFLDVIAGLLVVVCILAMAFVVCNGVIAFVRYRISSGKMLTEYEAEMIRNAIRRDIYEDIARFAREYYGDYEFSSKIRQLYFTQTECPECEGKGKRWQNSTDKCEHCWGTGKQLKD